MATSISAFYIFIPLSTFYYRMALDEGMRLAVDSSKAPDRSSPFTKVLIANRGEIACRVIRACKSLGLQTVAICSEADISAAHAQLADSAVVIGPARPAESYLRGDRIIETAISTGAQAIHPGYGFLSESAEFAAATIGAGLTWIGPSPATIADMGDKERARTIARALDIPVLPGSERFDADHLGRLPAAAAEIGCPLLVKATAGGGGIGMRLIEDPAALMTVAAETQEQARRLFGDGRIYLERFVPRARHVEVQVLGDGTGEAIHLHERECSVQRRYQKIIEESPAPRLMQTMRRNLVDDALRLTRSQRYLGAGTIEFLVDDDSAAYYFLEMNTRIQVEHPVTEMVTGLDIVAEQIRLAAGHPLSSNQCDIRSCGHAIECRLYAEDPTRGFQPSPGILSQLQLPQPHVGLRIDTGYRERDRVTPYYDPLIAKIISHGASRAETINQLIKALKATSIQGLRTNRDFLLRILTHPDFQAGSIDTRFATQLAMTTSDEDGT